MKKMIFFIVVCIIAIIIISLKIYNFQLNISKVLYENKQFEKYINREITENEMATIINKTIDMNIKNNVKQDEKGNFIDNGKNSIKIVIEFTDLDRNNIYTMENIHKGGINEFLENYKNIKFKCTTIEYHKNTKKVKKMVFKQITN